MAVVDDKVLKTIQNLLARQNHPNANEHEAQVCADKVQTLLLKHNLDMASIPSESASKERTVGHVDIPMAEKKAASFEWCLDVASAVSFACTCKWLWMKSARMVTFVGEPTDIAAAIELYRFLIQQIEDLSIKTTWGIPDIEPGVPTEQTELAGRMVTVPKGFRYWHNKIEGNAIKFRRGFLFGCARRVGERLEDQARALREQLNEGGQVTALVAVKDGLIRSYIAQQFRVGNGAGSLKSSAVNHDGFRAGYAAGGKVDLSSKPKLHG